VQILEMAAEYGFKGEEWQGLAGDMAALTHALREGLPRDWGCETGRGIFGPVFPLR
jgi:hypothetical protein